MSRNCAAWGLDLPLAALLIAGDVAVPPLLGADPIEFQIRRARDAGAEHAVVYIARISAPLLAAIDRLRRDGLSVAIARSVADVAEYIHPDESVLMIAPDVVVSPARLIAIAGSSEPTLLCVRDEPANERFERIDATARWTGIARIDGDMLRRTAAMVGDWDMASTLMRRAVQDGAARTTLTPDEAAQELLIVDSALGAQVAGRRLVATAPIESAGWATHWMIAPVARLLARVVGDFSITAQWVTLSGFLFALVAAASSLAGWIVASLFLLLAALTCDVVGSIGTKAGAGTLRWEKWRFPVRAASSTIVVFAMGTTLTMRSAQWGCLLLAVIIVGATWLAAPLARDDKAMAKWRSDLAGHAVIGVLGFAFGAPIAALAISAAHAVFSLGWIVRKALSGLARP